ncbi:MAG TPA: plastocyanin/azurin family copper-binding protein, partial [Acidimicrobiia bacterium]
MKAGRGSVRWIMLILFGALAALPTLASAADTETVVLKDTTFNPAEVTVAPGDTVVWKNEDQAAHTVTFDDGSFDSHPNCVQPLIGNAVNCMNKGETVQRRFDQPGQYKYGCKLHAQNGRGMVGMVLVKAVEVTATTASAAVTTLPPTTVTTAAATTTTTRKLATSSTLPSTTTSTVPAETTTTLTPNEAPTFDPGDDGNGDGQSGAATPAAPGGGGDSGSGTVALIVAMLLAVAGGGGLLL